MTEIHISDIRGFKSCRRKWYFSSPLHRNLEPNVPYAPFFTGRAVHYCLQQMYREKGDVNVLIPSLEAFVTKEVAHWTQPLFPEEQQMVDEQTELIRGIFLHYALWRYAHRNDPSPWMDQHLRFVSLEQSFNVPFPHVRGVRLAGRFDGVVQDARGQYWIFENKTARSIAELQKSLANDEQNGVYAYAANKVFGIEIAGVIYNIMRKKVPTSPKILKNGELSQAANIDTSAEWYKHCVDTTYPTLSDNDKRALFGSFIEQLRNDPSKQFFARIPVRHTKQEIDILMWEVAYTAREMIGKRTQITKTPSPINCNMCQFRAPCLAASRGQAQQMEELLTNDYRIRIDYDKELEEINESGND